MLPVRVSQEYSTAERRSDAVVHIAGIVAAAVASPVLILLAVLWPGDAGTVTATLVYAVSLVAMLTCSAVYNMSRLPAWRDTLRRIDQSAIYMKIAGTYTPFAVMVGSQTWVFLAGIWGTAIAGATLVLLGPPGFRRPSIVVYLALGWAGYFFGEPLLLGLTETTRALIVAAGLLYSLGVLFLLWERLPHHVTVWHVFVLVASATVYWAVVVELASRSISV